MSTFYLTPEQEAEFVRLWTTTYMPIRDIHVVLKGNAGVTVSYLQGLATRRGLTRPAGFRRHANRKATTPVFWYLASPYSSHPDGPVVAWEDALDACLLLHGKKLHVFSPIVNSHWLAARGGLDLSIWLPMMRPIMVHAIGVIELRAPGWSESHDLAAEVEWFRSSNRAIVPMIPGTVPDFLIK